jgi:hypothetical protein
MMRRSSLSHHWGFVMDYFLVYARKDGARFQFVVVASNASEARAAGRRSPHYPGALIIAALPFNRK